MTNLEKLLNLLNDGDWHPRKDIYEVLPKSSYRNAILAARRRGYYIELKQYGVTDTYYRLRKDISEPQNVSKNRVETCLEVLKDGRWHSKPELDKALDGQTTPTIHRLRNVKGLMIATGKDNGSITYKLESEL